MKLFGIEVRKWLVLAGVALFGVAAVLVYSVPAKAGLSGPGYYDSGAGGYFPTSVSTSAATFRATVSMISPLFSGVTGLFSGTVSASDLAATYGVASATAAFTSTVTLTGMLNLSNTTNVNPYAGMIYKNGVPFIHNYKVNGTVGESVFVGETAGNLAASGGGSDVASECSGFGYGTLSSLTTGNGDTGIGNNSLNHNTTGTGNTAVGAQSLYLTSTGTSNTALGLSALQGNVTGSRNIAIGFASGLYELGSDSFYVNDRDRTNTAGDKTKSILYGVMANNASDQTLTVNANLNLSLLTGSKVLVSSASGAVSESAISTETLSYMDATSSIQTQLNTKASTTTPSFAGTSTFNGDVNSTGTVSGVSGTFSSGAAPIKFSGFVDVTVTTPTYRPALAVTSSGVLYISTATTRVQDWIKVGSQ